MLLRCLFLFFERNEQLVFKFFLQIRHTPAPFLPPRPVDSFVILGESVFSVHLHRHLLDVALNWVPVLRHAEGLIGRPEVRGVDDSDWYRDILAFAALHKTVVFDEYTEAVVDAEQ